MAEGVCEKKVYSQVYKDNAEYLRNFLYYKCGNLETARDITQESFIRLWNKCKDVVFGKAKSFLFTVGNNLFLDQVKSSKVRLTFENESQPKINKEDPFYILRTKEFKSKLEQVISELPDGQREVFLMNRIDKMTYKEISEVLGVSQTAIEKRMSKALTKLRDQIVELKTIGI